MLQVGQTMRTKMYCCCCCFSLEVAYSAQSVCSDILLGSSLIFTPEHYEYCQNVQRYNGALSGAKRLPPF